jgi:hypothetical protein
MPPHTKKPVRRAENADDASGVTLTNPETLRQIEDSLRQEVRGEQPIPFRDILAAQREVRST